ncbi:hypothetical protein CEXT_219111 [Caerostris extrusa]|uniref:Uncharacterized protein n=1 Tax=Caerostris extrusa TaxID=172846 RepID=A0AAV4XPJ6_CAEEX|nr:hypothetical protein CEXT_219111 [Caerostris extrusa]
MRSLPAETEWGVSVYCPTELQGARWKKSHIYQVTGDAFLVEEIAAGTRSKTERSPARRSNSLLRDAYDDL